MQKKIIALALAGMSSVAFAQSNVTISGQMKVSVGTVSASGGTAAASNMTSRVRVEDQNSNIRFAGTEDLGNGLKAFFQLESAIGTSDNVGTTGSNLPGTATSTGIGTRNTAVGLTGGFGTFLMGKWDAHYNSMANVEGAALTDGLALPGSSLNLLHRVGGIANGLGGRLNNVVAYVSPNFSGFDALIAYAASGAASNEANTNGLPAKETGWNMKLAYNNGPINATYSHLRVNNLGAVAATPAVATAFTAAAPGTGFLVGVGAGDTITLTSGAGAAAQGFNVRSNRLGAAYTFPMGLKVGLIWDNSKIEAAAGGALAGKRTAWALPLSYKMGANKFSFTYVKAGDTKAAAGTLADTNASNVILGYEYSLSKRTSVSATYSAINNAQSARYDFWHPSSNVSGGGLVGAGADPRSLQFGIRHTF